LTLFLPLSAKKLARRFSKYFSSTCGKLYNSGCETTAWKARHEPKAQ